MARVARRQEDIESVKLEILEAAKGIIYEQGFAQLSMRKLASALGMTAANIYNYYANKDEIYLGIQTAGFAMLVERYEQIDKQGGTPLEVLTAMGWAYIDFGLANRDYYEVMLGSNTPKYIDYVDTPLESAAFHEKKQALSVVQTASQIIVKLTGLSEEQARRYVIKSWIFLHGIISLHNNESSRRWILTPRQSRQRSRMIFLYCCAGNVQNSQKGRWCSEPIRSHKPPGTLR